MPELPDVEGFRAVLARHGKWLIARTDGPALLMHFGMTGELRWADPGEPRHRHDRVIFVVDGGELRFRDMRKLQGITLAKGPADIDRVLAGLGPDALGIGPEEFGRALAKRDRPAGGRQAIGRAGGRQAGGRQAGGRQAVKAALIDQSVVAGLGNLLADEILWRARIHPRRPVRELEPAEQTRVHAQMRKVLGAAIPAGRVPVRAGWLTGHRDRDGGRCPRCGTVLMRDRIGGRTTVWCRSCQPW
ncbi:MAG TPA: DNA-formamidopyrimidine glycosylase family protein [Streptosporangiaceae bacterium]|nr:DNA-formamidopyrimidine glycosylase family protein [Streptosporangiaceae bacterium]